MLVALVLAGAAGGLTWAVAAARWPVAPRVSRPAIEAEVQRHPRLAALLRRRTDPTVATGLALTVALAGVIGGGLGVAALLWMARHHQGFADFDLGAARWGADHASGWTTTVLRDVSLLGGTAGLLVVVVAVVVIEHRRMPQRSVIPFVALVVVGQNLLANGIKLVVDRVRPDLLRLTGFAGSSFPSGHATASAATYAALALVLSRGRRRPARIALAGAAGAIATTVAASRVLLGVHWLTDVLAGLALGWAWFAVCSIAVGGRLLRFGQPVKAAEEDSGASAEPTPADR